MIIAIVQKGGIVYKICTRLAPVEEDKRVPMDTLNGFRAFTVKFGDLFAVDLVGAIPSALYGFTFE